MCPAVAAQADGGGFTTAAPGTEQGASEEPHDHTFEDVY
eukprot:gene46675-16283_t